MILGGNPKPLLGIIGPTASGKSDFALQLVAEFPNLEILSVDSGAIFEGLNIGTAKPSQEVINNVPHHLLNLVKPDQRFSVANFLQEFQNTTAQIWARGKVPLMVGGSMMYFDKIFHGMAQLPFSPELTAELERFPEEKLYQILQALDPLAASRIALQDKKRLVRAVEVCKLSSQPISVLQKQKVAYLPIETLYLNFVLVPETRAQLYLKIDQRFDLMLKSGLAEELAVLRSNYNLSLDSQSMKIAGYQQIFQYQEGLIPYATMVEKAKQVSRNLAKHQLTWLKSLHPPSANFLQPQQLNQQVFTQIESFLSFRAGG